MYQLVRPSTKGRKKMREVFISIDIEFDGPIPGDYSMTSLGACMVDDPEISFYLPLKPIVHREDAESAKVAGHHRPELITHGIEPISAMLMFERWLADVS